MKIKLTEKVKDRPFAEGSRGYHELLSWMSVYLVKWNITLILPLVMVTFIWHSGIFITLPSQVHTKLISLPIKDHTYLRQFLLDAPMTTYLKDLTQSIGSYSGLSWKKLGLGFFGCTGNIST